MPGLELTPGCGKLPQIQSDTRTPTSHITGCHTCCVSGIIRGSRGDAQQLLWHIMLLIYWRVHNIEPVEIHITYYMNLIEFVLFSISDTLSIVSEQLTWHLPASAHYISVYKFAHKLH